MTRALRRKAEAAQEKERRKGTTPQSKQWIRLKTRNSLMLQPLCMVSQCKEVTVIMRIGGNLCTESIRLGILVLVHPAIFLYFVLELQ